MGWLEVLIDESAIRNNLRVIREKAEGKRIFAVVKSNAYGHGMLECVKIMVDEGLRDFAVATVDEAVTLRESFGDVNILIMAGFLRSEVEAIFESGAIPVVSNFDQLNFLLEFLRRRDLNTVFPIHVEFDTGMGRTGFLPHEVGKVREVLDGIPYLKVEGIMSHFSSADSLDEDSVNYTKRQIEIFREITRYFPGAICHIANSAGLLYHRALFDAIRVGIALYGGMRYEGLKQVMHARTRLVEIKDIPENWFVSYGRTYRSPRKKRIGVASCGYSLGLWRRLYPGFEVYINRRRAPVIGVICMDLFVVDLDGVPDAKVGDYVYILGGGEGGIDVFEVADRAGTITYEVLCSLGGYCKRNRRVIPDLTAIQEIYRIK